MSSLSSLRLLAVCFSTATLLFGRQLASWMDPVNRLLNHWQRADALVLASAILVTAAAGYAAARIALRCGSGGKRAAGVVFILLLVDIALAQLIGAVHESVWWINWLLPVGAFALAGVALVCAPAATLRAGATVALLLSPLGLIVISQLLLVPSVDVRRNIETVVSGPPASATGPVIILLFDDWSLMRSIDSAGGFSERLGNLRSLAGSSFFFARAASPATHTLLSIPRMIYQTHGYLTPRRGVLLWTDDRGEAPSSQVESIFSRAVERGYKVHIFGFYLPYRALVGDVATEVLSDPQWPKPASFAGKVAWSFVRNIELQGNPLTRLVGRRLFDAKYNRYWFDSNVRIESLVRGRLQDGAASDLVFAHFGVPHSPFVFSPHGVFQGDSVEARMEPNPRKYRAHIEYVDRVLGRILQDLRTAGTYDQSLLVITSDHNWNFEPDSAVRGWRGAGTHVPLIVKWPYQTVGARIEEPACLVGARVILDRHAREGASVPSPAEMTGMANQSCAAVRARIPSFSAGSFHELSGIRD